MIVRALDANHDWQFGKGLNDYKSDLQAVIQNIDTRLNCFLGDCFFDQGAGIDWFNQLGGKDELGLNLAISAVILNTDFVTNLNQLFIVLSSARALTVSYNVSTSFGSTNGQIQVTI